MKRGDFMIMKSPLLRYKNYFLQIYFLRLRNKNPANPAPNKDNVAGSGTGAWPGSLPVTRKAPRFQSEPTCHPFPSSAVCAAYPFVRLTFQPITASGPVAEPTTQYKLPSLSTGLDAEFAVN